MTEAQFDDSHRETQPESGLEVVQSEYYPHPVPQVHISESHNDSYPVQPDFHYDGLGHHYAGEVHSDKIHVSHPDTERRPDNSCMSRRKIVIVAAIGVVLILAAVLGGVLGSRASKRNNESLSELFSTDAMTGSTTSVSPGLAPAAISWGSPHLEVYALTKNTTQSIYRKWRSSNATSLSDFTPPGKDMALVGGSIDTNLAPYIAGALQLVPIDTSFVPRTEIHTRSTAAPTWRHKFHDNDNPLLPEGPDNWDDISSSLKLGSPWSAALPIRDDGPSLHTWATPAVVAWAGDDSRLDVFAVSLVDNHILHTFKETEMDEWAEYENLKGFATVLPTVVSREPGRLDVFTRGGNGGLWHLSYENDSWAAGWSQISGTTRIQGQPDAVSTGSDSIDVFALGENGALLYKTYDGVAGKWRPEDGFTTLISSGLVGHPKAIAQVSEVHVFAYNNQNQMLWQTIGTNKSTTGDAIVWAHVPYPVV
ncbi:hypothetical protein PG994_005502 [Apiospora phragmitis]|uniref:PLL-like beta propeller domain-containing protein n=1 Tax=Apiospora phragmitis TaxID=2905665 RepID=A0ABR1VEZ2_9PEZI